MSTACGGQVKGVFADEASATLDFSPALTPPLSAPPPPPSLCHIHPLIHPPAHPLAASLTYTHTRNHECTGIAATAAAPRDGDLRCVCECLFPVSAETRGEWVSVMLEWAVHGRKGGESRVKGRTGDISKDLMRCLGNVSLHFSLSYPDNLILCRMCHNYSSCHCTGCLSLCPPAACESCSSGWPVPRHPVNTWMNTGSTGDLRFLVLCTSDLFLKVRVTLPFYRVWDASALPFKIYSESK